MMAISGGRMDIQAGILWILSWWIEVPTCIRSKMTSPFWDTDRSSNLKCSELISVASYFNPLQNRVYELWVSNSPEKVMEKSMFCRIIFGAL